MHLHRYFSISVLFGTLSLASQPLLSGEWRPVREGKMFGISGIASIEIQDDSMSFLVVHDNKRENQGRVAMVSWPTEGELEYSPLAWPTQTELPIDLESLTSVPPSAADCPQSCFMAASSSGRVFQFSLDMTQSSVEPSIVPISIFDLPHLPEGSNLEGFALQEIEGRLLAVWAHRGSDEEAAILYLGELDLESATIDGLNSIEFRVPWPVGNVRHVSDLNVDDRGSLYITSATDNGDNGPFDSAVYIAGQFGIDRDEITFESTFESTSQWQPIARYENHKIEAIAPLDPPVGGTILGTDDENFGSSLMRLTP